MPGEKGSYRSVYSAIWDDPEFQALPPMAQLVFFCLRTSKDCNFPCIFPHYHSALHERIPTAPEGGIEGGLQALIEGGWIRYDRPVLWIVKGLKNEPSYYPNSALQVKGIIAILKSLPKLKIVEDFADYYEIPFSFYPDINDGPNTPLQAPLQGGLQASPTPPTKQGTGTGSGTGKGKRSKTEPVDNSNASPLNGGAAVRGAMAPPAPPPAPHLLADLENNPEVRRLGEVINQKLGEGKPKWGG